MVAEIREIHTIADGTTIDGVPITEGPILVMNQPDPSKNGVYEVRRYLPGLEPMLNMNRAQRRRLARLNRMKR